MNFSNFTYWNPYTQFDDVSEVCVPFERKLGNENGDLMNKSNALIKETLALPTK